MNKRKDSRITKVLKVKIHLKENSAWGVLQNLSPDGLYLKTNYTLAKGETISIELSLPNGDKSRVKGLIRRIEAHPDVYWKFGLGVKLLKIDDPYLNYVHNLNDQLKKEPMELINQI